MRYSATRPTSLRPRSTSMMCSARSLGSASSSSARARSSASSPPRRRVPASGRIVTIPSSTRTRISGELPIRAKSPIGQVEQERAGIDHPQHPVDVERLGRRLDLEPLAGNDLEDVAGLDVFLAVADDRLVLRRA